MIEENSKIRKGLPPKHNPVCYQVLQDIVIPAGTILRSDAEIEDGFSALIYPRGKFFVRADPAQDQSNAFFKKVIA